MGSLRAQAERDLATTLEGDWGVPVTITDPDGKAATLQAQSGDIGVTIDPETAAPVAGRRAHVALRMVSLAAAGFGSLPRAHSSGVGMPWVVRFDDLAGGSHSFAVRHTYPDRALGVLVCIVEHWRP